MTTTSVLKLHVDPFPYGTGVTDHLAESKPHAISIARNILGSLNMAAATGTSTSPSSSPYQLANAMAHSRQVMQRVAGSAPAPVPAWEEPLFPAEELRSDDQNVFVIVLANLNMLICTAVPCNAGLQP